MTVAPPLQPIIKSLRFPMMFKELQAFAEAEERKRSEFFDWITPNMKAEFINGEVVVQPPAMLSHGNASSNLASIMRVHVDHQEIGCVLSEKALVALTRNDYLPDICYFGIEKSAQITSDTMRYPPPDFVVEILSPSTERTDRTTKFDDYADHGVQEYWLVDPTAQIVEQYILRDGQFELLLKVREGQLASEVIEGFAIPVQAIFDPKLKNRILVQLLST